MDVRQAEPHETRHIVVRNEQAVISPGWSVRTRCSATWTISRLASCAERT
ncbi:hypothetical protein [Paraburkholderia youngii]|uniref:5-keto 4-deoxyuronate isomerase n=1 Tax=Paraburkholderia youngii TaxID=2782701 RepID=A0A7W8P4U3_9BURK|nr:5-keto 4-deoxyuronate isomerase [Paraburkholderia youngii]